MIANDGTTADGEAADGEAEGELGDESAAADGEAVGATGALVDTDPPQAATTSSRIAPKLATGCHGRCARMVVTRVQLTDPAATD